MDQAEYDHILVTRKLVEEQFNVVGQNLGLSKDLIARMAHRIVNNNYNADSAARELDRSIHLAASLGLAKIESLNTAAICADDELNLWRAKQNRPEDIGLQLLGNTVDLHILLRDVPAIAMRLIEHVKIMQPTHDLQFNMLQNYQNEWFEKGCNDGLALELEVAILLAQHCSEMATDADQRANALNGLGIALKTRRGSEDGTKRLDIAIQAHQKALSEINPDRNPLQWVRTKAYLCSVYLAISVYSRDYSEIDEGLKHLKAAIEMFKATGPHFGKEATEIMQLLEIECISSDFI